MAEGGERDPVEREKSGRLTLNRTLLVKLVVIACVMFGFGYALVPVYRQMCEALGINLLTQKDGTVERPANTQVDLARTVTVTLVPSGVCVRALASRLAST